MELAYTSITYPRRSSDFSFLHTATKSGGPAMVFGICDAIGRTSIRHVRKFLAGFESSILTHLNDPAIGDVDSLAGRISEEMEELNRTVLARGRRSRERVYGVCLLAGAIVEDRLRLLWLGDCRAYLVRPVDAGTLEVSLLSEDHNKLNDILDQEPSFTLMKNELSELSRTLNLYAGYPDEAKVRATLEQMPPATELKAGDLVLLLTDGVHLPMIRAMIEMTNYTINRDQYYLIDWLGQYLGHGHYFDGPDKTPLDCVRDMVNTALEFTSTKRRFRDDIAAVGVWVK